MEGEDWFERAWGEAGWHFSLYSNIWFLFWGSGEEARLDGRDCGALIGQGGLGDGSECRDAFSFETRIFVYGDNEFDDE